MSTEQRPLQSGEILSASFLENRARILELAAFLDRLGRAEGGDKIRSDYRYQSILNALALLGDDKELKAKRILQSFSDQSTEPIASASDIGPTVGTWKGADK